MESTQTSPSHILKYLEEDGINQEFISLLSSLPTHKGWILSHLYQYQGFWHPSIHVQGMLNCQRHFQAHESDIILTTTPKSGTTWLKALTTAVVNRKTHDHSLNPLLTSNPHDVVPFLENLFFHQQFPDLASLPAPRVFSTHLPAQSLPVSVLESGCKVVYMGREPKDAFISLWHFANKLRPSNQSKLSLEEAFEMFCKGVSIYGPFWDHVLTYWKYSLECPHKVLFLKFEDLKEEPELHLKRLAEFLGYPFSLEEENNGVVQDILRLCSFDNLSNLDVNKNGKSYYGGIENNNYFRKGKVGDSDNYLTSEMIQKFHQISQEKFHPYGLKF